MDIQLPISEEYPYVLSFAEDFLDEVTYICSALDINKLDDLALALEDLKESRGRLFVLGVGGSAANASHATNDLRKLCLIEAYAPTDNVAELTARTNDDGWDTVFEEWLKVSQLGEKDALLIFSVGGGSRRVSENLIHAIDLAKVRKAKVFGVTARAEGYTHRNADISILIPVTDERWITPLAEAMQSVIWHFLVSHPSLKIYKPKW